MLYYTDGGTANNGQFGKQKSVICVVDEYNKKYIWENVGDKTNNEAELLAIYSCIKKSRQKTINIVSDSLLAVNLINRKWKTGIPRLKTILEDIWKIKKNYSLTWMPRDYNCAGWLIEKTLGI